MPLSNFERMIKLADEVFDVKDDPSQLDVNEDVIKKLKNIHPATVSQFDDDNGPVAWVLLIPTTNELMNSFLSEKISEKELFELTQPNQSYDSIYLCSAMVLEEYRRKGIARKLTINAIERIRKDHPIKAVFVWAFSKEGELAAENIAGLISLPLYKRRHESII